MRKKILISILFISSLASAKGLTSRDSLLGFDCLLSAGFRVTQMNYNKAESSVVHGIRNTGVHVEYAVNSAGSVSMGLFASTPKSQISLSGQPLADNQYLTMIFNKEIPSGISQNVSGTLLLVKMNGSIFLPQLMQSTPIGSFTCRTVETR